MSRSKMIKQVAPLVAILTVVLSLGGDLTAAEKTKVGSGPGASRYERSTDPTLYVGAETCKTCHEEQAKSYDQGPHWKTTLDKHKGPEWQGCEACHGPGKEHAESADPSKIKSQPIPAPQHQPSLGASLIANGIVRTPNPAGLEPLAPIRRMSQAEKIAFYS